MSKTKRYSTNREVAQAWWNNDDTSVRREGSNFWCQHNCIYSFSTCIAEIFKGVTICSTHSHSGYTARHQNNAVNAAKGKRIFIDIPIRGHTSLVFNQHYFDYHVVAYNERNAAELFEKAVRAWKHREHRIAEAESILESLTQYAELVGLVYVADKIRLANLQAAVTAERRHELWAPIERFSVCCPNIKLGHEQAAAMLRTGAVIVYRETDWPDDVYLTVDQQLSSMLRRNGKGSFWQST